MTRKQKLKKAQEIANKYFKEHGSTWYWIDLYRNVVRFESTNIEIPIE